MKLFIERVRARAAQLGLSQDEVARRAGFRERTFNHYLTRGSEPNFAGLLRICDVLVTHPNYLLGATDDPAPAPGKRSDSRQEPTSRRWRPAA
jgi:transcriptional regulator with XRE-family HTH domain